MHLFLLRSQVNISVRELQFAKPFEVSSAKIALRYCVEDYEGHFYRGKAVRALFKVGFFVAACPIQGQPFIVDCWSLVHPTLGLAKVITI